MWSKYAKPRVNKKKKQQKQDINKRNSMNLNDK